jgi:hypothetical protein
VDPPGLKGKVGEPPDRNSSKTEVQLIEASLKNTVDLFIIQDTAARTI